MRTAAGVVSHLSLAILWGGLLATPAAAQVFGPGPSDSSLFDTVIDLPPAPNFGSGQSIGGDGETTQVNLGDGGFISSSFDVLAGAELNVRGGRINTNLDIRTGGELNVSGGSIGFTLRAFDGSFVTMTGGLIDQSFEVRSGATMRLRGGALSRRFQARAGNDLSLFGTDYKLNGEDFFPSSVGTDITLGADDVFTGTLEDGSAFIFSPQAGDVFLGVTIQQSIVLPPDPTPIVVDTVNPVRPSGVRAGQTLTLRAGGELPENFEAVDATVNIEGGFVNDDAGFSRSTVNISGGRVDAFSQAYAGTTINLTGGEWGTFSDAHSGSVVNVSGGTLGGFFEAQTGSTINIQGGVAERFTALSGSTVNIAGGAIGFDFDIKAGSDAELFGGDFRLNGEAFTGSTLTLGDNDVFTATLADGSSHIFAGNRSDDIVGLKLVPVSLPTLNTTPQVISTADHGRPSGLRAGQTLTVVEGGVLGNFFEMVDGSTLNIDGGTLGEDAAVVNGTVNLRSGIIERALIGGAGSVVNVTGGVTGSQWEAKSGSTFNISGGDIGSGFTALDGSVINISGGTFDEELIADGGTLNITGGDLGPDFEVNDGSVVNLSGGTIGNSVSFGTGSRVNFFGTDFRINGEPLRIFVQPTQPLFGAPNSVFSGVLADGTPFSFDFSGSDFLSSEAILTVTLTTNLPGDYNGDGTVDAADYTVWRDSLGSTGNFFPADGNYDGRVNEADYLVWRDNFGRQAGGGPSAAAAIPEPTAIVLLGLGGLAMLHRRMR